MRFRICDAGVRLLTLAEAIDVLIVAFCCRKRAMASRRRGTPMTTSFEQPDHPSPDDPVSFNGRCPRAPSCADHSPNYSTRERLINPPPSRAANHTNYRAASVKGKSKNGHWSSVSSTGRSPVFAGLECASSARRLDPSTHVPY